MPICADAGTDRRCGWSRLIPTDKPGVYHLVYGGLTNDPPSQLGNSGSTHPDAAPQSEDDAKSEVE